MATRIQHRRGTASEWTTANPVLAEGELGLETDTAKWKIGDGATAWTSLGYVNQVVAGPASVSNSGASPALTITNTGSGYSLLVEDSASTDSTPFVIDASGNVGIGVTPIVNLHVQGATWESAQIRVQRNSTDASAPVFAFVKQRGTAASPTIVAAGDLLGETIYYGHDGAGSQVAASIQGIVDTTPGAGDMPGRLSFNTTADGTAAPTERMRINNAGLITGTGTSLGAWTAYTPTVTAQYGTPTTTTANGRYTLIGKTCTVTLSLHVTDKGTGSGGANLTLPFTAVSGGRRYSGAGRENGVTGDMAEVLVESGGTVATMWMYNNSTPWVDSYLLLGTITYEIA